MLSFQLNNGRHIPAIGLGTYLSESDNVKNAVEIAINNGYRHIDTASLYGNEAEIGEALHKVLSEGKVKREELFITTKLWSNRKEEIEEACKESLKKLQLDYLDLYLIHQPVTFKKSVILPKTKEDFINLPIEKVWGDMESLVEKNLTKSIGVSNFTIPQLKELLAICKIKPVVNQIEFNVYNQQSYLFPFCKENHIHMTAYSPLCNNDSSFRNTVLPSIFEVKEVKEIAEKYNKTVAQVVLRFILQQGLSVIPKSDKKERIISNCQIVDWALKENDIKIIQSMNKDVKTATFDFFFKPMGITYQEFWSQPEPKF
ncbi:Aldose reductase [Entamoeba marina]